MNNYHNDFVYSPFFTVQEDQKEEEEEKKWCRTAIEDAGVKKHQVMRAIREINYQLDRNVRPRVNGQYVDYNFLYDLAHYTSRRRVDIRYVNIHVTPLMAVLLGNALMNNGSEVQQFWENDDDHFKDHFTDRWIRHVEMLGFVYYYTSFDIDTGNYTGYWVHERKERRASQCVMDEMYKKAMQCLSIREQRTVASFIETHGITNMVSLYDRMKRVPSLLSSSLLRKIPIHYEWYSINYNTRTAFDCVYLRYVQLLFSNGPPFVLGPSAVRPVYETNVMSQNKYQSTNCSCAFFLLSK